MDDDRRAPPRDHAGRPRRSQDREFDVNDAAARDAKYLRQQREAAEHRERQREQWRVRWQKRMRTIGTGMLGGFAAAVGTSATGLLAGGLTWLSDLLHRGWVWLWR